MNRNEQKSSCFSSISEINWKLDSKNNSTICTPRWSLLYVTQSHT